MPKIRLGVIASSPSLKGKIIFLYNKVILSILSQSFSSIVCMNVLLQHRLDINIFYVIVLSLQVILICYKYFLSSFKRVSYRKHCKLKQNNQFHENETSES